MNDAKGSFIVISGPSGVGKTVFLEKILKEYPQCDNTVTYTTRPPREDEKDGEIYHFIDLKTFNEMRDSGEFIESANVHGQWYATAHKEVQKLWDQKKTIVKDLDIQGAQSIKSWHPKAVTIFIHPPSIDELKKRILKRGKKNINNIEKRLQRAQEEIAKARQYDHQIMNDDFERAWQELKKIIEKAC